MRYRWGRPKLSKKVAKFQLKCSGSRQLLGTDVTLVGWGAQILVLQEAAKLVEEKEGISCEIIDLQTILPWDKAAVCEVGSSLNVRKF